MTPDRRTLEQLRARARQARESGRYTVAARLERQAVERAGALGWMGERTRALLWEGYSLRQAGEDDLALAALLQAASERAAPADPADGFSALIAIIHISLDHQPFRLCRALLDQARYHQADLRRPWSAPLDFLEGELQYRRGEFAAAWEWYSRAWARWCDVHPRLTAATHLWALCRAAFRRRDVDELTQLTETLTELDPNSSLERQLVRRARLLSWRARRVLHPPEAAPVGLALDVLAATRQASRDFGVRREVLRTLALAGCWEAVDDALSRSVLEPGHFESALLLGDLALNRARAVPGLPAVDDDYGEEPASLSSLPESARSWLDAAIAHYRAALPLAEIEDERLETGWHGAVVRERLART